MVRGLLNIRLHHLYAFKADEDSLTSACEMLKMESETDGII